MSLLTKDCSSPYSGEMITLKFGRTSKNYQVPIGLIKNFSWAPEQVKDSRRPWFGYGSISMPDIAEDIGHVLVHYLHTGTYQILLEDKENCTDYRTYNLKVALEVLFAAQKCEMGELQELAKSKIKDTAESMKILDVVRRVDSVLQKQNNSEINESRVWLYRFLSSRIRLDFGGNLTLPTCIMLLEQPNDKELFRRLAIYLLHMLYCQQDLPEGESGEINMETVSPRVTVTSMTRIN
ncbi:hypothetical protein GcM1_230021 [Golovinomyces cichoracearum]|uniref:Uncharacterized protein n=1 Tax=Golovinomyces cichoracearum TaxID=62708 RepID=A0A420IN20_9PEZI|nr:hypothetical protein GcM1_230021 [Golovinomyces cichoracearum]